MCWVVFISPTAYEILSFDLREVLLFLCSLVLHCPIARTNLWPRHLVQCGWYRPTVYEMSLIILRGYCMFNHQQKSVFGIFYQVAPPSFRTGARRTAWHRKLVFFFSHHVWISSACISVSFTYLLSGVYHKDSHIINIGDIRTRAGVSIRPASTNKGSKRNITRSLIKVRKDPGRTHAKDTISKRHANHRAKWGSRTPTR